MANPTPEEIQLFLSSLGDDTLAKDLQRQIDAARELRNYRPPTTNVLPGGNVVANVPGVIGNWVERGRAAKDEEKAQAKQDEMLKNQQKITADYFNKLYGNAQASPLVSSAAYGPQPFKDGGVI